MGIGQALVEDHMASMNEQSRRKWPPIKEIEGYRIVEDRAYQGFDVGFHPWWTEPRFWCRLITVERVSDGVRGWGIGPQVDAYEMAVKKIQELRFV